MLNPGLTSPSAGAHNESDTDAATLTKRETLSGGEQVVTVPKTRQLPNGKADGKHFAKHFFQCFVDSLGDQYPTIEKS